MAKGNRFSALRQLREQQQEEDATEILDPHPESSGVSDAANKAEVPESQKAEYPTPNDRQEQTNAQPPKRGPGRPRGRRSNPDYTQISAYIPLKVLLEVQHVLAQEQREQKQRTPRPVSDLMEELLSDWLKKRKNEMPST